MCRKGGRREEGEVLKWTNGGKEDPGQGQEEGKP